MSAEIERAVEDYAELWKLAEKRLDSARLTIEQQELERRRLEAEVLRLRDELGAALVRENNALAGLAKRSKRSRVGG